MNFVILTLHIGSTCRLSAAQQLSVTSENVYAAVSFGLKREAALFAGPAHQFFCLHNPEKD